jgi:hypothetical protein
MNAKSCGVTIVVAAVVLPRIGLASEVLTATMGGAQEVPPNSSTATGQCSITVDPTTGLATFTGTFAGLRAPATAAAVRGPASSTEVAPAILTQTTLTPAVSGIFSGAGTLGPAFLPVVLDGQAYCELDDGVFPAGEIRGQLAAAPAPPTTPALPPYGWLALLLAIGSAGLVVLQRRGRFIGLRIR